MTIGLCMIVKNESAVIARALNSAAGFADEIVVVDTGSTDGTKDIVRRYTDKVYDFEWCDDFSKARNFALEKVESEYWMWLDADDIVPVRTASYITKLKRIADGTTDVYMLPYVTAIDERGKPTFSYYRERIMRKSSQLFWRGRVHEAVVPHGKVERLPFHILHKKPEGRANTTRNLDIYRRMRTEGVTFEPRERYYYARELYYNGYYTDAAAEFSAFLDMPNGFDVNKADACLMLSRCVGMTGNAGGALSSALRCLEYGPPNGEACCEIGSLFLARNDYDSATFWYECAVRSKPDLDGGAFIKGEYYGFVPLVWLTVCYDRKGDAKKAFRYHLRARKLRPDHPSVIANDAYFKGLGFKLPQTRKQRD